MRIAYFDTIAGISGDMTLGAFLSAGVRLDALRSELGKLHLEGVEIDASHIQRNGITAVKAEVVVSVKQTHHRHLADILTIIDRSTLKESVKENAKKIFMEVARAESTVHNIDIGKVHFHEVGALDSIVDIVGCAICLDQMEIAAVYASPVKVGSGGFVDTEHGKLPLPGPATSEILKGYPIVLTDIPFELTTPTGAAIVKALSRGTLQTSALRVECIGYGAGSRELQQVPNLLRILIGELPADSEKEELVMVETNIDDMNPEIFPYVMEQVLAAGAKDVYVTPVMMKKGRPGNMLTVLAERAEVERMLEVVFRETTTIGVRIIPVERRKLVREVREVETRFGRMRMKMIIRDGKETLVPEFEECRKIAMERNIPLVEVYRELERGKTG
ncbi:MAG TPA: nickel pincer cofactor biosynthesis protein LarC [Bacteroidota bacterium]|nr:nickel pincer cofactor biosynthesis protein LarC [Bacteroidota bacterium]